MTRFKTSALHASYVVICLYIFFPSLSYAPLVTSPKLLKEPATVSDEVTAQRRKALNQRRQVLDKHRVNLEKRISQHDSKCSRVPASNTALAEDCRSTMNRLMNDIMVYNSERDVFDNDVRIAVAEGKSSSQPLLEFLFSKGSKDSAPVDLRFIPIDKPIVIRPEDVSGIADINVDRNRNDLRDALAPQRGGGTFDDQVHALTADGLDSFHKGDFAGAIGHYRSALKLSPNDRGIQLALGHVLYLREKGQKGSPKAEIILDALQSGKGDWQASISYLSSALDKENDEDKALLVRDALNYIEGLYAYQQFEESKEEAELNKRLDDMFTETMLAPATMVTLREGFANMEKGDYMGAIYSFKDAQEMNPKDMRIREILNYTEGLLEADMKRLLSDDLQK